MIDAGIGANSASGGYNIEYSSVWESDLQDQAYLTQGGTAGTRTKHTWSMWIKRTELGTRQMLFEGGTNNTVTTQLSLSFQTTDALEVRAGEYVNGSVAGTVYRLTNRVFRDTAAWYHIVAAFDTTQGTANDRIKIWVNGVQETSFATTANPGQNTDLGLFAANAQSSIGVSANNAFYVNGYIAHPALVYNAQLNADSFGEFDEDSGIWKPIDLTGVTFGTYGYWIKNEIANQMWKDSSGSSRDFANWDSTIAQATDTPTNNFAIMNVINPKGAYSEGGTKVTSPACNGDVPWATSTIPISTGGKWYCELKLISANNSSGGNHFQPGITAHQQAADWAYTIMYRSDGLVLNQSGPSDTYTTGNTAFAVNDIMAMAYDSSARTLKFYKNGTLVLTRTAGALPTTGDYFFGAGGTNGGDYTHNWNFGGYTASSISSAETDENGYGTFEYAPPTGYYALCTKNLAEYG